MLHRFLKTPPPKRCHTSLRRRTPQVVNRRSTRRDCFCVEFPPRRLRIRCVFDFFFHHVFSKCRSLRPLSRRAMHAPRRTHESRSGRAAVFPEETFFYANKIIEIIRRANVSVLTSADKSIRYVVNPTRLRAHTPKTSTTNRIHASGGTCRKNILYDFIRPIIGFFFIYVSQP